jgi:hypothetical protein
MPDFETLPIGTKDRLAALERVAQQALEALEKTHTQPGCDQWQAERKASVALRAALAQQENVPRRHQGGEGGAAWHRSTLT